MIRSDEISQRTDSVRCERPLVVAVPFLFFGLIWQAFVQLAVGGALLALAFGIWMLFAED